jgi:type IV pilus assembly protein PilB
MYDVSLLEKALVSSKVLTAAAFATFWQEAGKNLGALCASLLKQKLLPAQVLNDYLLRFYDFKYVNLDRVLIPPTLLRKVPKEFSIEHELVIFGENSYKLQVAMVQPNNLYAIEYVRRRTGKELEIYITDLGSFQSVLKGYKSDIQNLFSNVLEEGAKRRGDVQDIKNLAVGVPITKAVNSIIEYAVSEGASDIHIEPTENEVIIRFRIDGMLRDVLILLKSVHPLLTARIKIMADLKIDEHRRPQDGRIRMTVNDLPISLRVSVIPTYHGEKVVMRILDESASNLTLKDLGFRGAELEAIEKAIQKPDGMILVTGPTGCGKTTTLYTAMKILNRPEVNITTIEDPIEYSMPRINQTQVNPTIGVTFANGLRSLLRQDPDIIMVGEIRDEETANMAIHSAMTGHLVLSTLHTNDAPGAIPRFIDMGAEPFLLASTLNLAIAQRLVRKLCNDCKKQVTLDSVGKKLIDQQLADLELSKDAAAEWYKIRPYEAVGCSKCGGSGYKGRIGIFEAFEITDKVRELIVVHSTARQLRAAMMAQGHMPMFLNGLALVKDGITTLVEIIRVAQE